MKKPPTPTRPSSAPRERYIPGFSRKNLWNWSKADSHSQRGSDFIYFDTEHSFDTCLQVENETQEQFSNKKSFYTKKKKLPPSNNRKVFLPNSDKKPSVETSFVPCINRFYDSPFLKNEDFPNQEVCQLDSFLCSPHYDKRKDNESHECKLSSTKSSATRSASLPSDSFIVNDQLSSKVEPGGKVSVRDAFYKHCRKTVPDNVALSSNHYITACKQLSVPPRYLELSAESFNFGGLSLGKYHLKALSKHISKMNALNSLNLSGNRVQGASLVLICDALRGHNLQSLDLSENNVGKSGVTILANYLRSATLLRKLNLSNCLITDQHIIVLINSLQHCSLKELDLSYNKIEKQGAKRIASILNQDSTLVKLSLAWNNIQACGIVYIAQALMKNIKLQELDLSWNSINASNVHAKKKALVGLSEMFGVNFTLFHLIMKKNNFSSSDLLILDEGLKKNHTLLFHLEHESSYVNASQHIELSSKTDTGVLIANNHACSGSICWLCDQWIEHTFEWEPEVLLDEACLKVSIDNFKPRKMEKRDPNMFSVTMFVPLRKKVHFYFSDKLSSHSSKGVLFLDHISKEDFQLQCENCFPRWVGGNKHPPIKWELERSIFSPRLLEFPTLSLFNSEKSIAKAFEVDWNRTKLHKVVKNTSQLESVKNTLQMYYYKLVKIFRYYSAFTSDIPGNIFDMGMINFGEFCSACHIIDKDSCCRSDIDTIFIAVNVSESKTHSTIMQRFGMIEAVVRISLKKYNMYQKLKEGAPITDAIKYLMEDCILPNSKSVQGNSFRRKLLYTEDIQNVYNPFLPALTEIFNEYSTRGGKKQTSMSISEATYLLSTAHFFDDNLSHKNFFVQFVASKLLYPDETESDCYKWLTFFDFLEFLVRLSYSVYGIEKSSIANQLKKLLIRLLTQLQEHDSRFKSKFRSLLQSISSTVVNTVESKEDKIRRIWRERRFPIKE